MFAMILVSFEGGTCVDVRMEIELFLLSSMPRCDVYLVIICGFAVVVKNKNLNLIKRAAKLSCNEWILSQKCTSLRIHSPIFFLLVV